MIIITEVLLVACAIKWFCGYDEIFISICAIHIDLFIDDLPLNGLTFVYSQV